MTCGTLKEIIYINNGSNHVRPIMRFVYDIIVILVRQYTIYVRGVYPSHK